MVPKVNIDGASNTGLWLDGSLILNNGARANFDPWHRKCCMDN
jgi:hypothetical protein